ncbi:hypothetical protein RhiirA4_484365, partial [Rhizophagus irregularis]
MAACDQILYQNFSRSLINFQILNFLLKLNVVTVTTAREILLLNDDGLSRYYPQSLVKQYQFKKHSEFAPIDIIATFNSIVNWHFPSDSDIPIQPKQFNMLYIILHELMHGLGFTSNWQNWFLT